MAEKKKSSSKKKTSGSIVAAGRSGSRDVTVRVKTARRRKTSSTQWLQRQLNDPYVAEAQRLGYRSRAAFKLLQLDDKYDFLRPGVRVVDLGAAPGGWCQVAVERGAREKEGGCVVGLDILEMDDLNGVTTLQADFTKDEAVDMLFDALDGRADVVMSDMAAPTTGHKATDHLRIMNLIELAYDYARQVLNAEGTFIAKVFQGGAEADFLAMLKRDFKTVTHMKPHASRQDSSETYIVARGFRGAQNQK